MIHTFTFEILSQLFQVDLNSLDITCILEAIAEIGYFKSFFS